MGYNLAVNIREATEDDINAIFQLGSKVDEFQVSKDVVTFWPKETLRKIILESEIPIIVAFEDNNIVGFVITNYNSSFGKAIIENIFVLPEFRRKQIGRELLNALLELLQKNGCQYVCTLLESNSRGKAHFRINDLREVLKEV